MISKEIRAVAGTKLFSGVNHEKTKQITIYANTIDNASKNNAMVLPVPFPDSVVFHNLEKYKDFFSDCESCFINMSQSYSLSSNSFGSRGTEKSILEVHDVGSYKVSLAHSLDDLKRVDTSVFELSKGLDSMLKKHYSNPVFGFIICKLAEGNEKYHPFAYSHNIANEKVFIPTRHYHDESISSYYNNYDMFSNKSYTTSNIDNSPMFSSWSGVSDPSTNFSNKVRKTNPSDGIDSDSELADDWNHDIYLYNIDLGSNTQVKKMNTCKMTWSGEVNINLKKLDFSLDRDCRVFNKLEINGNNPNIDLVLSAC
jgi:hypothetical protein